MRRLPYLIIVLLVSLSPLALANGGPIVAGGQTPSVTTTTTPPPATTTTTTTTSAPTDPAPPPTTSAGAGMASWGAAWGGDIQTSVGLSQLSDAFGQQEDAQAGRTDAGGDDGPNVGVWDQSIAAGGQAVSNAWAAVANGQTIDVAWDIKGDLTDDDEDKIANNAADRVIETNQGQMDANMGASDARISESEDRQGQAEDLDNGGQPENAAENGVAADARGEEADALEALSDLSDKSVDLGVVALQQGMVGGEEGKEASKTALDASKDAETEAEKAAKALEDKAAKAKAKAEAAEALAAVPDVSFGAAVLSFVNPANIVQGYEDYDALAGWLLGIKDADAKKRQDELRDKFCEGMGAAICAIAKLCESELYDFEDIDGVVVGLTASGELISVMHAEGWRTTGAVFINETTGEVFPGVQRYLYKATWNVDMAKLAAPGAGAITKLVGPANGYNVVFKENSVVKHSYYDDWYLLNASESHGFTNANPFLTYSNNYYDELCLVLQTPIDVKLGTGLSSKSYSEICNEIVEHTGDPTLMYRIGTPPGTPQPGTSPGF